jgi:hypothetical protein
MGIILEGVAEDERAGQGRLARLALSAVVRWISQYTHGAADCTAARSGCLSAVLSSSVRYPTKRGCHCLAPRHHPALHTCFPCCHGFLKFIP